MLPDINSGLILTIGTAALGLTEVAEDMGLPTNLKKGVVVLLSLGAAFLFEPVLSVDVLRNILADGIVAGLLANGLWNLGPGVKARIIGPPAVTTP